MANLGVSTGLTITTTDLTPSTILMSRAVPGLINNLLTAYFYEPYFQVAAAPTAVNLPGAKVQAVMIRNQNAAGGSNITVTWTPQGGASVVVATLTPGSVLFMLELDVSLGISALSLQSSAGVSQAEVLVGS